MKLAALGRSHPAESYVNGREETPGSWDPTETVRVLVSELEAIQGALHQSKQEAYELAVLLRSLPMPNSCSSVWMELRRLATLLSSLERRTAVLGALPCSQATEEKKPTQATQLSFGSYSESWRSDTLRRRNPLSRG